METVPRAKKPRKRSLRKAQSNVSQTYHDEVLVDESQATGEAPQKNPRYVESSSLAVHSGIELGRDQPVHDAPEFPEDDNVLDVDLAELSLGQRLTAIGGDNVGTDSDGEARNQKRQSAPDVVPAHSLTRTLIQALHSSDAILLETCLAHSDSTLIRNTVRRLPPHLAVPLLLACVERLGRGSRAVGMKTPGSQRAMVLITWIKITLAVQSSHLVTIPDLVARLAGLYSTLTSRLALQDSLLSLNGKLDMVISQIEMRSSSAPAPLTSKKNSKFLSKDTLQPTHYVEGESEDEDREMATEPPIESDSEEGSVEKIELGDESEGDSFVSSPRSSSPALDEAEEFNDDEDEDDESE